VDRDGNVSEEVGTKTLAPPPPPFRGLDGSVGGQQRAQWPPVSESPTASIGTDSHLRSAKGRRIRVTVH